MPANNVAQIQAAGTAMTIGSALRQARKGAISSQLKQDAGTANPPGCA